MNSENKLKFDNLKGQLISETGQKLTNDEVFNYLFDKLKLYLFCREIEFNQHDGLIEKLFIIYEWYKHKHGEDEEIDFKEIFKGKCKIINNDFLTNKIILSSRGDDADNKL